jgi:hypothetical protein
MEPEIQRDIHEFLTSYGYEESKVCNWNQSGGVKAKYYCYEVERRTVHEVYVRDNGYWEHSILPIDQDRWWLPGGFGNGLDFLKDYLQNEHKRRTPDWTGWLAARNSTYRDR